jgi:hypothetical protein
MKIILTIRTGATPNRCTITADMKRESADSVRVSNLGLDIKAALDEIIKSCEADGSIAPPRLHPCGAVARLSVS